MASPPDYSDQMDRGAAYIVKPEHIEATIGQPEKKKGHWKELLIIAVAVVTALIVLAGLAIAIVFVIAESDKDSMESMNSTSDLPDKEDKEDTEDKPCLNLPPGLMKMTSGVLILNVDTDPRELTESRDGETTQVIDITCNEGRKFSDQNEKEWDVPDQVAFIENLYVGQISGSTSVFQSSVEYDNYRSVKIGIQVGKQSWFQKIIGIVKNKAELSWSYYRNVIIDRNRKIIKAFSFFGSYKIVFKSYGGLRFAPSVMSSFQNLPNCLQSTTPIDPFSFGDPTDPGELNYRECKNRYKDFIDNHGTHYYTKASLGGRVWSYFHMSTDDYNSQTQSDIQASAKLSFFELVGIEGELSLEQETAVEVFNSKTENEVKYSGGEAKFYSPAKFNEWRESVLSHPAKYDHELAPIYLLVDETDPRRQIMEEAFEDYIMEAE